MSDYFNMTQDEYDEIFNDLSNKLTVSTILSIPGVQELVKEELNNAILTEWDNRKGGNHE